MIALIIGFVAFFLLRLTIYFFVPADGIELNIYGRIYSVPKDVLTISLWAFFGFPTMTISFFVLWERRKGSVDARNIDRG